jgi:hypothetical protein
MNQYEYCDRAHSSFIPVQAGNARVPAKSRPGDKVQFPFAHELRTFVRVVDKFDVNTFLFEKAELNGRDSDEI